MIKQAFLFYCFSFKGIHIYTHTTIQLGGGGLEIINSLIALIWYTQFQKLVENLCKVFKELAFVISVIVEVLFESLVIVHGNFSRKHHHLLVVLVYPLCLATALDGLLDPLAITKSLVVFVGEHSRGLLPGAFESRAVRVATAKRVSANQSNNFLVIKAHTVEDVTNVTFALTSIG